MPNICELRPNLQGGRPGMQWGVPIDDARHWNFHVRAGRTPEEADALRQNPGPEDPDTRAFVDEQASAILAGRLTIEEALSETRRRANIVVQDHVAQGGQMSGDTPPDLGAEHLGREDAGSIMIRKLWVRELRALANGRSVKSWRHPGTQVWGTPLEILNIPV
jgi:5,5'-dehydrodivanillate O-demethylase